MELTVATFLKSDKALPFIALLSSPRRKMSHGVCLWLERPPSRWRGQVSC
jgi:hypothetical protein